MAEHVTIDDVESYDLEGIEPMLLPVGKDLKTDEMRPSVWDYDEGAENRLHYHEDQEELYVPLSGRFELHVDDETIELDQGEVAVVDPSTPRKLTAIEGGRIFVVGAPPVKDDSVDAEQE